MSEQRAVRHRHRTERFWNMPAFFTSLVGREKETGELANLLRRPDVRLLTLSGPVGIGKTRLSMRVALAMREFFADGVCFVALSSISNPERVFPAIAEALSLQEIMGQSVFDQVACALRDKDMLLLLDNFEQVIDAGFLLEDLLSTCPPLKLMVTSREILTCKLNMSSQLAHWLCLLGSCLSGKYLHGMPRLNSLCNAFRWCFLLFN